MIFWFLATVMTLASAVLIARPLLRKPDDADGEPVNAADYDVEVFKSQLQEVDRDLERGRLTQEEAEASRIEISRRLLAADTRRNELKAAASADETRRRSFGGLAIAAVVGSLAVAVLIYGEMGAPGRPDMPLALRDAERQQAAANQGQQTGAPRAQAAGDGEAGSLDDMADRLQARLDSGEGDASDWSLMGRTEMMRGNYADAARAYARALEDFPEDSALNSSYGEALVFWANGEVTDRAKATFDFVLQLTPGDPRARFYLAEFEYQQARPQAALNRLVDLLMDAGPDAPWIDPVRSRAVQIATELDLDVAEVLPPMPEPAAPSAPPGPTEEDMAAAQDMTPEDRQAMIRGMVDGLAERLAADPSDFDGWMRLIRSRMVLGERDAAQAALNQAATQFANAPFPMQSLTSLAAELGLDPPMAGGENTTGAAPRGPSADDIAAAAEMTDDDRAAMIEGMVGNLAARLEDNPDDLEGWTMLGRSYTVLGREEDAVEAYARASELDPANTELLIERARLLRTIAGERQTDETVALMRDVEAVEPDNLEALWFLALDGLSRQDADAARGYLQRARDALPEGQPEYAELAAEIERLLGTLDP